MTKQATSITHSALGTDRALVISNQGYRIAQTNYWTSPLAKKGFCFLSGNAGGWRLLLPEMQHEAVKEFSTVGYASIEKSLMVAGHFDIIAEDGTSAPFCISIGKKMIDRRIDAGKGVLLIYTESGPLTQLPLEIRL